MTFKVMTNADLAEELFSEDIIIEHVGGDSRLVSDIKTSVLEELEKAEDFDGELAYAEEMNELMSRHIRKLEKMLDSRKVRYKNWGEVENEYY